jgi:hypothetical protein
MLLIKIESNKVKDVICSDREHEGYVQIDDECFIGIGEDVRSYDSSWKLRPLQDRIDEGLVTLTEFEKVDGENIVTKTRYDLAKEGKILLAGNEYFDDEAKEIKSGTFQELFDLDKISQAEYEEFMANDLRMQRDIRLSKVDAIAMNPLRWAALTPSQQSELAGYRQALLDVPQQAGFPREITWPAAPDSLS